MNNRNINNEKIFEEMKTQILKPSSLILIVLERKIRKTSNDNQNKGLDFLKQSLDNNNNILYTFLQLDKNKVNEVLYHIGSELEKCNKNHTNQNIFKEEIRKHFNKINDKTLDEFKNQVKSGC